MRHENDNFKIFVNNLVTSYSRTSYSNKVLFIIRLYKSVGFFRLNDLLKKYDVYDEFWRNVISYHIINNKTYFYSEFVNEIVVRKNKLTVEDFVRNIDYSFDFELNEPKDKPFTWEEIIFDKLNYKLLDLLI